MTSWACTAAAMSAGVDSQSRVESSMSVNRNVTVPDGGCTDTAALYCVPNGQIGGSIDRNGSCSR